jgi:hypothetical protein
MKASKKKAGRARRAGSKKAQSETTPQKAQSRTTPTKARARMRHYDPEMIRDFLMQLRIELQNDRIAHAHSAATNGEPLGDIAPFVKKYGSKLLYKIGFGEVTEDQQAEIDRTLATARQKQLEALEFLLETAFKEALTGAAEKKKAGGEKSITFSADDWTKWTRNGSS